MEYKTREAVPNEYKWDLTTRYKSEKEWEKDYLRLVDKIKEISEFKGKVVNSSENLFKTLNKYFEIDMQLGKLFVYASLKDTEDLG